MARILIIGLTRDSCYPIVEIRLPETQVEILVAKESISASTIIDIKGITDNNDVAIVESSVLETLT